MRKLVHELAYLPLKTYPVQLALSLGIVSAYDRIIAGSGSSRCALFQPGASFGSFELVLLEWPISISHFLQKDSVTLELELAGRALRRFFHAGQRPRFFPIARQDGLLLRHVHGGYLSRLTPC